MVDVAGILPAAAAADLHNDAKLQKSFSFKIRQNLLAYDVFLDCKY